jgi:DNA-binding NarL/FixJ family response regulator
VTAPLRVLVADDHPIVREGLRAVLGVLKEFELVGTAATGQEAVEVAAACRPDVVVMDLHMPDLNGVEATRALLATQPDVAVLILTMFDDDDMLVAALKSGARGYLLKGASHTDIVQALQTVARGGAVFGAGPADRLLNHLTGRNAVPFPALTTREREILGMLAAGGGNQDVARTLFLSPKTVRNHVANILAKLDVPDRAQAIAMARSAGLGDPAAGADR